MGSRMKTFGLLVLIWLALGLLAEALMIDDRPLKFHKIALGPLALARERGWV